MLILGKNIRLEIIEQIEQIEVNLEELESLALLLSIVIANNSYETKEFAGAINMLYTTIQSTHDETILLKDFYKKTTTKQ